MLKIKKLSDIPIRDACEVWNQGFVDYYVNMQMTVSQFTFRLGWDELSPDYSFIAYYNGLPAGIILNGINELNEKRGAWNGGTAVAFSFRGKGIAKKLMESTVALYNQENVDTASLEAFTVNERAIRLYESFGYRVADELVFLKKTESKENNPDSMLEMPGYSIHHGLAHDIRELSFYQHDAPWKTLWNFIRNGESIVMKDENEKAAAYALFQKKNGNIILYQCAADERRPNKPELFQYLIDYLQQTESHIISTYNLPGKNQFLINILEKAGFKQEFADQKVPLKQVWMKKEIP
ncbi:GNAT family N-acetyltransferase [Siminovitchia terrae]|uniref:GNAT family N-acetyltransferase n=1 Tax=Siminovitchia terrae TaxID=1914933 RepID=UPI0028B1F9FE|nr:GNAT family N-acetyltransferase [Siminovitchia terrae]